MQDSPSIPSSSILTLGQLSCHEDTPYISISRHTRHTYISFITQSLIQPLMLTVNLKPPPVPLMSCSLWPTLLLDPERIRQLLVQEPVRAVEVDRVRRVGEPLRAKLGGGNGLAHERVKERRRIRGKVSAYARRRGLKSVKLTLEMDVVVSRPMLQ